MKNSLALVLLFVVSAGSADAMIIRLGGVLEEDYYPEMQKGDRITAEITMPDPRLHEKEIGRLVTGNYEVGRADAEITVRSWDNPLGHFELNSTAPIRLVYGVHDEIGNSRPRYDMVTINNDKLPSLSYEWRVYSADDVVVRTSSGKSGVLFESLKRRRTGWAWIDGRTVTHIPGITDVPNMSFAMPTSAGRDYARLYLPMKMSVTSMNLSFPELIIGDANLDGMFDQFDIIKVIRAEKYRQGTASWEQGDWNSSGRFDHRDLVASLQAGPYPRGTQAAVIPEPSTLLLAVSALLLGLSLRRGFS